MKTMKKAGLAVLALMLALSLGTAALGENPVDSVSGATAAGTAGDEAQAKADALNEAMKAYDSAKADSRKQEYLDNLKQELENLVAAGKLTGDQAELIYGYYTEQMTLRQNNGMGAGRGGKGGRNGQGMNRNGSGKGGRNGRFSNTQAAPTTEAPAQGNEPAGN